MRVALLAALLGTAVTASGFQSPTPATLGAVAGRVIEAHSGDPARSIRELRSLIRERSDEYPQAVKTSAIRLTDASTGVPKTFVASPMRSKLPKWRRS